MMEALLLPLRGVLKAVHRSMVLAGYLMTLYFIGAIMEAWSLPAQRWSALLQTVLCAVYFTALVVWSGHLRRASR